MNIFVISFLIYICLLGLFFIALIIYEKKDTGEFQYTEDEEQAEWIRNWNEKKNNKRRKRT